MKPNLFVDTNVMVDLLAHREPFYEAAAQLFSLADRNKCTITIAALSFSTTAYLLERKLTYEELSLVLRQLLSVRCLAMHCLANISILPEGLPLSQLVVSSITWLLLLFSGSRLTVTG